MAKHQLLPRPPYTQPYAWLIIPRHQSGWRLLGRPLSAPSCACASSRCFHSFYSRMGREHRPCIRLALYLWTSTVWSGWGSGRSGGSPLWDRKLGLCPEYSEGCLRGGGVVTRCWNVLHGEDEGFMMVYLVWWLCGREENHRDRMRWKKTRGRRDWQVTVRRLDVTFILNLTTICTLFVYEDLAFLGDVNHDSVSAGFPLLPIPYIPLRWTT